MGFGGLIAGIRRYNNWHCCCVEMILQSRSWSALKLSSIPRVLDFKYIRGV